MSVLRTCKFTRQPEESVPEFTQCQSLPFLRKTSPLKSCYQVVGQSNYFQVECVSLKNTSGNLCQRIVFTDFPNATLHSGATIVEVPHAGRRHGQVRMPGAIGVLLHHKQGRLWVALLYGLAPQYNAVPVANRGDSAQIPRSPNWDSVVHSAILRVRASARGPCVKPRRIGPSDAVPACPRQARNRSRHRRARGTRECRKGWRGINQATVLRCPPRFPHPRVAIRHPRGTRSLLPHKARGHRSACRDNGDCSQSQCPPDNRRMSPPYCLDRTSDAIDALVRG